MLTYFNYGLNFKYVLASFRFFFMSKVRIHKLDHISINPHDILGNDVIHELTSYRYYALKIILKDFSGETKFAEYSAFKLDDEAHNYRLTVNGYSGTAGKV